MGLLLRVIVCVIFFGLFELELLWFLCDQFSSCSVKKLVSCLNVFVCLELTTFGMYVKYYILQYVIIIRGMYVNYVEYMCMSCYFVCVEEGLNLERFLVQWAIL